MFCYCVRNGIIAIRCSSLFALMSTLGTTLRWRHNDHASVSNHQTHGCLLNRLFRRKSKKTSKLRVTGLCAGNSPGTGEFPAQMASYAENVFIWWRHHEMTSRGLRLFLCGTPVFVMKFPLNSLPHLTRIYMFLNMMDVKYGSSSSST